MQHTPEVVNQYVEGVRSVNFFDLLRVGFTPIRFSRRKSDGLTNTFRLEELPLTLKRLKVGSTFPSEPKIVVEVFWDLRIQLRTLSGAFEEGPFAPSSDESLQLMNDIREIQRLAECEKRHAPAELLEQRPHAKSVQRIVSASAAPTPNVTRLTAAQGIWSGL